MACVRWVGRPEPELRKWLRLFTRVDAAPPQLHTANMSKVQQLEAEMQKLSPAELQQIRDWLDDMLEDHLAFSNEFETQIRQSEDEMKSGARPRTRQP